MHQKSFSPKARWDRHIPETENNQTPEQLNEKIEVLVWFSKGKIKPQILIWNNKEYRIKNINYSWQERCGAETLSCFSVDTDPNIYQISFSNTSLSWKIDKIIE